MRERGGAPDRCPAARAPWDLVLWRNMAIYLEPAAAEKLWEAIVAELRPGAYVVAGKADHPPRGSLERVAACVYRKGTGL